MCDWLSADQQQRQHPQQLLQVQRQYQKNGAAERRLEEATRLLNEARASQQTAHDPLRFAQPEQTSDIQPSPGGDDEPEKQFLTALLDGDEEKVLGILKKV